MAPTNLEQRLQALEDRLVASERQAAKAQRRVRWLGALLIAAIAIAWLPLGTIPARSAAGGVSSGEIGILGKKNKRWKQMVEARLAALEAQAPVPGPKGDKGVKGDTGPQGPQGDPGVDPVRVTALETLLAHFSRVGSDVYITGANLHILNGTGSTDGRVTGLGNLIVGYNELRGSGNDRSGSHNIVVGSRHNFSSYGGLIAGFSNTISGQYASVSGGAFNTASGLWSSVSGGDSNTASGDTASVSGGAFNIASGVLSSVSGGLSNIASGSRASVSGGRSRTATGQFDWVAGGLFQTQ